MSCDNEKSASDIEHMDWSTGGLAHHYTNVRFGSASSEASQSSGDICRICHCESDAQNPLLTPCYCSGSLKYVHQSCLQQWLTASETNSCELCKFPFIMHSKIKPINEWRSLDISGYERRRFCFKTAGLSAVALCVIWSLCVLIKRLTEDVQNGDINWPFWTKLAVVTVGLMGSMVFLYVQCRSYIDVINRWKARNRILLIQNAPEKVHPRTQSATSAQRIKRPNEQIMAYHNADIIAERAQRHNVSRAINGGALGVNDCGAPVAASAAAAGVMAAAAAGMQQHSREMQANYKMQQQHNQFGIVVAPEAEHARHCGSGGIGAMQAAPGQHNAPPPYYSQQQLQTPQQQQQQQQQQVAVAANIECGQSQHNFERDWALDDVVSQISSFRPCPQGSGSMIPFHDTLSHNILENSENSSRGSLVSRQDLSTGGISTDTGREHAMQLSSFSGSGEQKAPSISSGVSHAVANGLGGFAYRTSTHKRLSNSSIFNAQRDALTDATVGGTAAVEPDNFGNIVDYNRQPLMDSDNEYLGTNIRRYSDTKLLAGGSNNMEADSIDGALIDAPMENQPMLYRAAAEQHTEVHSPNMRLRELLLQTQSEAILDMELPTSPLSPPAAYASDSCERKPALRHSYDTAEVFATDPLLAANTKALNAASSGGGGCDEHSRINFASLPNLNSSCESLINRH